MTLLVKAIIRPNKIDDVRNALEKIGVGGITVTEVRGHGHQKGHTAVYRGREVQHQAIITAARTGEVGDGRVFVMPVQQSYRIRMNGLKAD